MDKPTGGFGTGAGDRQLHQHPSRCQRRKACPASRQGFGITAPGLQMNLLHAPIQHFAGEALQFIETARPGRPEQQGWIGGHTKKQTAGQPFGPGGRISRIEQQT